MIAFEERPVSALFLSFDKHIDHAVAVGAAISVITKEDDLGIFAAVIFDQVQDAMKFGQLTMDITNGVNRV
jgi:hypothetical protein